MEKVKLTISEMWLWIERQAGGKEKQQMESYMGETPQWLSLALRLDLSVFTWLFRTSPPMSALVFSSLTTFLLQRALCVYRTQKTGFHHHGTLHLPLPLLRWLLSPWLPHFLKKNHFHHFIIFIISIPSQMSPLQHLPHPINLSAFPMLLLVSFHLSIPKMILFVSSMTALYH